MDELFPTLLDEGMAEEFLGGMHKPTSIALRVISRAYEYDDGTEDTQFFLIIDFGDQGQYLVPVDMNLIHYFRNQINMTERVLKRGGERKE